MKTDALVLLSLALVGTAHADLSNRVEQLGAVAIVGGVIVGSALSVGVNATALAYDTSSPPGWRVAGYAFGGAGLLLGTGSVLLRDQSGPLTIGTEIAFFLTGVTAVSLSALATDEEAAGWNHPTVAPVVGRDAFGVSSAWRQ